MMFGGILIGAWGLLFWANSDIATDYNVMLYQFVRNFKIPYFAFIFAKVTKDHYSMVSSLTHAAIFAGHSINFGIHQWAPDFIRIETVFPPLIIATAIAVFLHILNRMQSSSSHSIWLFKELKFAYTNYRIIIWSLWFIVATAILNQFNVELLSKLASTLNLVNYLILKQKHFNNKLHISLIPKHICSAQIDHCLSSH